MKQHAATTLKNKSGVVVFETIPKPSANVPKSFQDTFQDIPKLITSLAMLLVEFVFSAELFPISFATLLNELTSSEELFPITFAK